MNRAYGRAELSGLDGYWNRLSDEELLNTTFTIGDPERLPDLCMEVPPQDQKAFIEYWYDFRGTRRPYIPCVHCKHPTHLAGFVIKIGDGRRFLVGHNCGSKIYGARFEAIHKEFEGAKTRAVLLRRMQRLREELPAFLAYLKALRHEPSISAYADFRSLFYKDMLRLFGALEMAWRRDKGELLAITKVRDFEAEQRVCDHYERDLQEWQQSSHSQRKKHPRPQPPKLPIMKDITERVGHLPAQTFFTDRHFVARDFHAVIDQFEHLATPAGMGEKILQLFAYRGKRDQRLSLARASIVSTDMAETLKQANQLLDVLDDLIGRLCEPIRLFQRSMLESICKWANKHPALSGDYTINDGSLRFTDDRQELHSISLPRTFKAPPIDGIIKFRNAINLKE